MLSIPTVLTIRNRPRYVAHNLWFFTRYHVPYNWMLVARGAGE